jgi:DNA polymerase III delta prime subunit
LILSGVQGSGKTTISRALIRELKIDRADVLHINASDETGVDQMRAKIKNFVMSMPVGRFKVVRLEEAEFLSLNAQAMLRALIEDFSDTSRFIITCNYENKLMPAIKSRMTHYRFTAPDEGEILLRAGEILFTENIDFNPDDLEKVIKVFYPDIRSII